MNTEAFIARSLSSAKHRLNTSWIIYVCYVEDYFFRKVLNQRSLLGVFIESFKRFCTEYESELKTGRLSLFVIKLIQDLVIRINVTSKAIEVEKVTRNVEATDDQVDESVPATQSKDDGQIPSKHRKFAACHQYFSDHITYPYPSSKAERMALADADGVALRQVDQWFTNHRKRSGWNDICNATENRETASKLVNLVLSGTSESVLPYSVTSFVATYVQRATNNAEIIPSEWLKDAISQLSVHYPFLIKKRKRETDSPDCLQNFSHNNKKIRFVNNDFILV